MGRTLFRMGLVVVLLAASAAAQEVYRWKDPSGRLHFSNVGPGEKTSRSSGEVGAEVGRKRAPSIARTAPKTEPDGKDPYSDLSEEQFSSVASRKRDDLRRELRDTKARIVAIDAELASLKRTRENTLREYSTKLQGFRMPEPIPSDREEELAEEKKEAEKKIADIHKRYAEVGDSAAKRHGETPSWLRPLE